MIKCRPMDPAARSSSWLRPAVHFLLLGGALLLGVILLSGDPPAEVVLTAERVAQLQEEWRRHLGRPPTTEEVDTLLAQAVEDELFFAEALDRGLDREDRRVRERLESLAGFVGAGPAANGAEEDLLDTALALDLHRRDALVHGRLVSLGKEAALAEVSGGSKEVLSPEALESRRREALELLRRKFRVRVEKPAGAPP
jgi:hypothetical protein